MEYLNVIGIKAQRSSKALSILDQNKKNETLNYVANAILDSAPEIMKANEIDIKNAIENNMEASLVDRLKLDENRIKSIADGIFEIIALEDPIGEILSMKTRPNGLIIGQKRVPLGVIGIIYESRPNVTADAFGLCFKTGNAVVLRGGSDAINSNKAIVKAIKQGLEKGDCPTDSIQLIEDISRETAGKFMKLHKYIDVLIPRGGAGLIKRVVEQSTIPIIETGTGNCHTYVDEFADIDMAIEIIDNAKTQRMGVCNACEAVVVHGKISKEVIPLIYKRLNAKNIEIRGDKRAVAIQEGIIPATDDDYREEFHGEIISLKVVDSLDEAIDHINDYGTKHSDAIVTKDYRNSQRFLNEIDSASVYVNASTRFSDGNEFGFGAEIGISTQKLHARGPMGLNALTSSKYIIYGDGHIRS